MREPVRDKGRLEHMITEELPYFKNQIEGFIKEME